jgi:hypothetical protein
MADYQVAHLREQGQDLIIVPVEARFGGLSEARQLAEVNSLQHCASIAGLAGTVCPVWQSGARFYFRAPRAWQPFFRSIDWDFVMANINRKLSCG